MSKFADELWQGLGNAIEDIRQKVVEEPMYGRENVSRGYSESMEYVIEPGEFARILKTGGRANGNIVTGIWFQGGRTFRDSGGNILLKRFAQ